jgi:hypothetical protein
MKGAENGEADNAVCTKNVAKFQFIQQDVNIRNCIKKFNFNKVMCYFDQNAQHKNSYYCT